MPLASVHVCRAVVPVSRTILLWHFWYLPFISIMFYDHHGFVTSTTGRGLLHQMVSISFHEPLCPANKTNMRPRWGRKLFFMNKSINIECRWHPLMPVGRWLLSHEPYYCGHFWYWPFISMNVLWSLQIHHLDHRERSPARMWFLYHGLYLTN